MYEILIRIPGRDEIKARLIPGTYRVGSSPASHLTLNASGVVPRHCLFTATDTDLKIADLGGGIEVDGEAFHDTTVHIRPHRRSGDSCARNRRPRRAEAGTAEARFRPASARTGAASAEQSGQT